MGKINLADRLSGLNESATLALNARVKQLAQEGKTVYNLTAGELASDTPQYIREYVAQKLSLNKYTPVAGLNELRVGIAEMARSFYGLDWIQAENVIVTAGAKPALYAAFLSILNPGDEVIVPTPGWVSHFDLIELAGGKVKEVELKDNFDLDADEVASKINSKTKAILINSPHNPTGAVFSKSELVKLADRLRGSNITVISDDIYAKLVYDSQFTLVPSVGFEQLIIVNGFSKSQAITGWRIGYAISEVPVIKAMTSLLSHINGNASIISQEAAMAAIGLGDVPPKSTIETLKKQRLMVDEELKGLPQIKYLLPGGAFYVFIDIRSITSDSQKWCEQLLDQTGVALVPGEAFKAPGFARMSFVCDEQTLSSALKLIKDFVLKGV